LGYYVAATSSARHGLFMRRQWISSYYIG